MGNTLEFEVWFEVNLCSWHLGLYHGCQLSGTGGGFDPVDEIIDRFDVFLGRLRKLHDRVGRFLNVYDGHSGFWLYPDGKGRTPGTRLDDPRGVLRHARVPHPRPNDGGVAHPSEVEAIL